MEQHKIQDGIQIQILFLETTFMEQQITLEIKPIIHFIMIHGGGLLRLLLMLAVSCAMLMAVVLIWTIATLLTFTLGSRCSPVLRCSVAVV